MLLCIGYKDKMIEQQKLERSLRWFIICGYADPKDLPKSMQEWWPIDGEVIPKIKLPTKKQLKKYDAHFRSLGKKK